MDKVMKKLRNSGVVIFDGDLISYDIDQIRIARPDYLSIERRMRGLGFTLLHKTVRLARGCTGDRVKVWKIPSDISGRICNDDTTSWEIAQSRILGFDSELEDLFPNDKWTLQLPLRIHGFSVLVNTEIEPVIMPPKFQYM